MKSSQALLPFLIFGLAVAWLGAAENGPYDTVSANRQQSVLDFDDDPSFEEIWDRLFGGIVDALKLAEIIPTVLREFEPRFHMNVTWPESNVSASLGNTLPPSKLQQPPDVQVYLPHWDMTVPWSREIRVVTVSDPDAPSRDNPVWSEVCHAIWYEHGNETTPTPIVPYKPPGPPPKTGKHRYVFIAWTKLNDNDRLHLRAPKERFNWGYDGIRQGVWRWAKEYDLVPVAANFIYAQNDEQ